MRVARAVWLFLLAMIRIGEPILQKSRNASMRSRRITGNYIDLQENRIGWMVFTTAVQVFLLVPITLLAVNYNGNLLLFLRFV
jgi:hypothetical protein